MDSRALVSVVIPTFNDSQFIRQSVGSVLAQTHRQLDVIVVDDGSTDGSGAVARELGPQVRVLEQPNSGAAMARNRGLDAAKGDYVAFLDADDCWHPQKIEVQLRHLRSCTDCIAVYCRKLELREDTAAPPWRTNRSLSELGAVSEDRRASGWLYLELLRASIVHTSTIMVSRRALEQVGRFDATLTKGQDLDYWLRLSRLGPMHMLDSVLSAYTIHGASISHRLMARNFHAYVVERAVSLYGPRDQSGQALGAGELSRILGASWFEFAYQHYRAGSTRVCWESVCRSLGYWPNRVDAWSLAVRATMKLTMERCGFASSEL